eukprot:2225351-Amphidinium_carterae.1
MAAEYEAEQDDDGTPRLADDESFFRDTRQIRAKRELSFEDAPVAERDISGVVPMDVEVPVAPVEATPVAETANKRRRQQNKGLRDQLKALQSAIEKQNDLLKQKGLPVITVPHAAAPVWRNCAT